MPIEIQIVSDTHIEFWEGKKSLKAANFINPSCKILALLGDICCVASNNDFTAYKNFINELLPYYEHIIIVTGNHEYFYNPDNIDKPIDKPTTKPIDKPTTKPIDKPTTKPTYIFKYIDSKIKKYCLTNKKLHFLNNDKFIYRSGKTTYYIYGCTLWSLIPEEQYKFIQNNMNDYNYIYVKDKKTKQIRNILASETTKMFKKNVAKIQQQITKVKKINDRMSNSKEKHEIIILTHHKPYLSPSYNINSRDSAYESDLKYLMQYPVVLWGYGHTHHYDKSIIDGVILYSNPKGYPKQKTGYKINEVIRLK